MSSKTSETGKTDLVSNGDFLCTVFGDGLTDKLPIVVSFEGSPVSVSKSAWFGSVWNGKARADISLPANANNYFSLAKFSPDEVGHYRRLKSRFHALYAVMLDDLGGKVALDRLCLPQTWLLETSPGNYQAGYRLSEPLVDGKIADRLMNAIVSAGLSDPGANGPRARLARLPVAVNGKHTPPFQCRMVIWEPERRYTVQELVDGLQLELSQTERPNHLAASGLQVQPIDGDPVWIPRPDENIVLKALRERGYYKAPLGEGKHDISCPWLGDHTDAVDGGTAYFEPNENWPIGGFRCLHGHCSKRRMKDLLSVLEVDVGAARMKPTIRIVAGEIHRVVDAAERELAETRRHYQRGGLIVTVVTDPGTHETRVQEITQSALVRALAGAATWERFDARAKDWVRTDPPSRHAAVLYDANSYAHLPGLKGLARQPYLRPDGSLMVQAGYDPATCMFGVFDEREFSVQERPQRTNAEEALNLLQGLLSEFSFSAKTDRAAALSAILTAAIRPSLPLAPMFHAKAHMISSGKSYLCELITAFSTPQRSTPTTFPADDEECRKLLLAELLRAPAVIEFDNLTGDLVAHKSLCTTLTSEFMSGRILGISKTATVSTRTLFLSSGNNVGPVQDMSRRCITIRLDPGMEIPAARTFKQPDLVRDLLRERGRYVSAALTIVRAWIYAGRPKTECRPLANYGEWSDLCRQPLLWLGCADPTVSVFEALVDDPDRETLARLLTAWRLAFGTTPAMVRDAVSEAHNFRDECVELREVLHDIAEERGEINRRKLGWWIKRNMGRIVDGYRFVRAAGNSSAEKWRVESISPVLSVSPSAKIKSVTSADLYRRASSGD